MASARRRVRLARTLVALAAALLGVLVAAVALAPAGVAQDPADPLLAPGEVVATIRDEGRLVAVDAAGQARDLLTGLSTPQGVAVLEDGAVVVAESGADRVLAVGGRFGPDPVTLGELPGASGVVAAADGLVLAISFNEGRLVRLDPAAPGAVQEVATGLVQPTGLAVSGGAVLVAGWTGGVVQVDLLGGGVTPVVEGFGALSGVAAGPAGELFVSDLAAGSVVEVVGDQRRVVAELADPGAPATDPPVPQADLPWSLLVPTASGMARLDPVSGEVITATELPGVAGVGVARASAVPGTLPPPTAPGETVAPTTAVEGGAGVGRSTEAAGAARSEGGGPPWLLLALVGAGIVGLVGATAFVVRRSARIEAEETLDDELSPSFEEAFGPCVTVELELESARAALDGVRAGVSEAVARVARTEDEVQAVSDELTEARSDREARAAQHGDDELHPIHEAEGHLVTDEGRSALADYRAGRASPAELAQRWHDADEQAAVEHVRAAGARALAADLSVPGQIERRITRRLEAVQDDLARAREDEQRHTEREVEAQRRVDEAREALEACRAEHGDDPETVGWDAPDGAEVEEVND